MLLGRRIEVLISKGRGRSLCTGIEARYSIRFPENRHSTDQEEIEFKLNSFYLNCCRLYDLVSREQNKTDFSLTNANFLLLGQAVHIPPSPPHLAPD